MHQIQMTSRRAEGISATFPMALISAAVITFPAFIWIAIGVLFFPWIPVFMFLLVRSVKIALQRLCETVFLPLVERDHRYLVQAIPGVMNRLVVLIFGSMTMQVMFNLGFLINQSVGDGVFTMTPDVYWRLVTREYDSHSTTCTLSSFSELLSTLVVHIFENGEFTSQAHACANTKHRVQKEKICMWLSRAYGAASLIVRKNEKSCLREPEEF